MCDQPVLAVAVDPADAQGGARLAKAFGLRERGFVLVRPDGIMATVCETVAEVEYWMELHLAS